MNRTALILGATGAVGKQLLKDILKNGKYEKVVTVGRRPAELDESIPQDKLVQKLIDFDNLDAHRDAFKNVSDAFCCLGTTYGEAGTTENFVKIDQTYVLNSAKIIAEENKPTDSSSKLSPIHFLYCSSSGSNKSSFSLYFRIKGQTEAALEETGFEKVSIFNPPGLEIVEPRVHPRRSESILFSIVNPISRLFKLGYYISVNTVGKAMHKVAEDASIKPTASSNTKISVIGSLVSSFPSADIEKIGNPK